MLLVIIDIGIAVKKIATMHQKYVLPESTWSFLPFSDETARTAQSRAMVPARICIGNKICIVSFPLNSCPISNPYKQRDTEVQKRVCHKFVTTFLCFQSHIPHFNPFCDKVCQEVNKVFPTLNL